MTELERVEADIRAATIPLADARDPAETEEQQRGKRCDEVVDQITDAAIAELRTLRDHLDDQIRAMLARRDLLKSAIAEQVTLAQAAINVRVIASDAVTRLTASIENGMPPMSKVITARKANGRG